MNKLSATKPDVSTLDEFSEKRWAFRTLARSGLPVPRPLLHEQQARSFEFPNPELLYATGPWRCSEKMLCDVEMNLGYALPKELRTWYLEVGVCRMPFGEQTPYSSPNNVLVPSHIPRLIDGSCPWMEPDTVVEPGALPFFERDAGLFLCVHPHSSEPNAVHWMWGDSIDASVSEFFTHMLEDPDWLGAFKPRHPGSSRSGE